jgi:two-component system alkaline phosphatase synthesis response regulator PhoP
VADSKTVLVIDDDPDFTDFVKIVLSANDYNVETAPTAQEGLQKMREHPPDLVIVDVMMSYVLDGWSVSREMQYDPVLCDIPVLMVSAIVSDKNDPLFPGTEQCRVDAFMSKPLDPAALLRRVAELVSR